MIYVSPLGKIKQIQDSLFKSIRQGARVMVKIYYAI